jgi:hypothetical protein
MMLYLQKGTALQNKMAVFWVVAPCSLVVYRCFKVIAVSIIALMMDARKHLWNFCKLLPDYTAQQPRRQPSSYSPQWEPQISRLYKKIPRTQLHSCIVLTVSVETMNLNINSVIISLRNREVSLVDGTTVLRSLNCVGTVLTCLD